MNIRTRTIIAIVVVLGVSTLALHRFISFQQTASYIEIESQDVTDNLKRIKETFLNDLRKLAFNAADWGSWDDTYQFVEDLNREYLNSNLGQQTPIDLDISTIFLLNEAGSLRYGIEVDIKREEEIDFDAAILNAFQPSSPLVIERDVETEVYGLVPIGDKLLMAAIAPIRRSDDSGENRGSFVMGRYLDREKRQELEAQTQLELQMVQRRSDGFPDRLSPIIDKFAEMRQDQPSDVNAPLSFFEYVDEETIKGHLLFDDPSGQPVLLVSAEIPRTIYLAGKASLSSLLWALLAAGLALILAVVILLDLLVLRRLSQLGAEMAHIGSSGDLSMRVNDEGSDELSILGRTINWMMEQIQSSSKKLAAEHARAEGLLLNILPASVAERLKIDPNSIADSYDEVSILFADIVGFTDLAANMEADNLVKMLNDLFSRFDDLAHDLGLEKIKTIGDSYMVASGLPEKSEDHAHKIAQMGLGMLDISSDFSVSHGVPISLRVGINSGVVVAGVIGKSKFIYDLWGDTVNIASRMESSGKAGRIQVTRATSELLKGQFELTEFRIVDIKGRGPMETFFLIGEIPRLGSEPSNG